MHLELLISVIKIKHGSMMTVKGHIKRSRKLSIFGEEILLTTPGMTILDYKHLLRQYMLQLRRNIMITLRIAYWVQHSLISGGLL